MSEFGGPPYTKHPYELDDGIWFLEPYDPLVHHPLGPIWEAVGGRDLSHHGGSIRIEDEPQRLIGPGKEE